MLYPDILNIGEARKRMTELFEVARDNVIANRTISDGDMLEEIDALISLFDQCGDFSNSVNLLKSNTCEYDPRYRTILFGSEAYYFID